MKTRDISFEKLMSVMELSGEESGEQVLTPRNGFIVIADVCGDPEFVNLVVVREIRMRQGRDMVLICFDDVAPIEPEMTNKKDVSQWIEGIYQKV